VEMWSGSEAGSYLRRIDFVYHSTLGLRVIKKKKKVVGWGLGFKIQGCGLGFKGPGLGFEDEGLVRRVSVRPAGCRARG